MTVCATATRARRCSDSDDRSRTDLRKQFAERRTLLRTEATTADRTPTRQLARDEFVELRPTSGGTSDERWSVRPRRARILPQFSELPRPSRKAHGLYFAGEGERKTRPGAFFELTPVVFSFSPLLRDKTIVSFRSSRSEYASRGTYDTPGVVSRGSPTLRAGHRVLECAPRIYPCPFKTRE